MKVVWCKICHGLHEPPSCGFRVDPSKMWLEKARVRVHTFKPYVEDGFTGKPIEITSRRQRDALCAKYHCTYDRYKETARNRKVPTAAEQVTLDEVMTTIEKGEVQETD